MSDETFFCYECRRERPARLYYDDGLCAECAATSGNATYTDAVPSDAGSIALEKERIAREEREAFDLAAAVKQEQAERVLARRRLLPFIKRINPDYDPGWVHADICQRLEKFAEAIEQKKSPRLMIFMPPRHGKLLADSTPVLTANRGWTTHGDLRVGDRVFHPSGRPVEVLAVSDKAPADWVVTFTNGDTIRCHAAHEWTVLDRATGKERTVETQWFRRTTKFGTAAQVTSNGRSMYQLPAVSPVVFDTPQPLVLDPYVLGAWLGDGSRGKGCITHDVRDEAVADRIHALGYPRSARCVHKQTGVVTTYFSGPRPGAAGRLLRELRILGVEHDKFIPEAYLRASMEDRLQLLAGLVDTDGHCEAHSGRVRFTTSDIKLAQGVVDLTTTLGFRPYMRVEQPKLSSSGIQGRREYYVVGFQPTQPIPCVLERKRPQRFAPMRRIGIKSVECVPAGERGHCIQVDSPDGLYLAGRTLLPTHNSEIGSKTFPGWFLGRNPKHEVIACSYSGDLAKDFSRKVRDLMETEKFQSVFPTRLARDSKSVERWNTSAGGGFVAAGVAGPITGRGAHLGIIDDPVKDREEAESETTRQKIKDWYSSTFYTRLAPGGGVLIIQTRWHEDDLSGWLLEVMQEAEKEMAATGEWPVDADRWEVVRYPAIATHDEPYRQQGEALHESRYPLAALNKIKRAMLPRDWEALYQQNPVSQDGDYFTKGMIRYYDTTPPIGEMRIYAAGDLAIGQTEANDYTVFGVIGIDRQQNMYLLDLHRGRWNAMGLIDKMFEIQRRWEPEIFGMETGHIDMTLEPFLLKRMEETGIRIGYEKLRTRGKDKQTRARPIQGRMEQGKVFFPRGAIWTETLVSELLSFPMGKHDDQVDCLAWLGQMLLEFGIVNQKVVKQKSFRDKLARMARGSSSKSAMSA